MNDPIDKPTKAETLATAFPTPTFDGWYCPRHPPGELLANAKDRRACWGCGNQRPELDTTEVLARWGDDVVTLARSRGMPPHLGVLVKRAAIAVLGPILNVMVCEMKPETWSS